jgi:hypothetical protein
MYQNLPSELVNEIFMFWSPKMAHEFKICKFLFDLELEIKAELSPERSSIIKYNKLKKYIYMYNKLVNTNKHYAQITPKSIVFKSFPRGLSKTLYYNEIDSYTANLKEKRKLDRAKDISHCILPQLDKEIYNYYICRFNDRIFIYIKEYNRLFPYWKK